jgi:c-di-GMP-binding flagellar brake protein YcgR
VSHPHGAAPSRLEKRRHLRGDYKVPVKISGEHGDILTETKNISASGAFCLMSQRLEPMTKLRVHLLLPVNKNSKITTKRITCQGVVVRSHGPQGDYYNTAIFFSDIAPKDSRTINDFVESLMENRTNGKFN